MAVKLTFDAGKFFDSRLEKLKKLEELGVVKKAVESGMKSAKSTVNNSMKVVLSNKGNMPAKGKYSTGEAVRGIDKDFKVRWRGTTAEILIGLSWEKLGVKGQVLIYGIPTQKPVKGLKQAIYGAKARRYVDMELEEVIDKVIRRVWEE
ncbi:MAG: hypothetical protein ACI4JB_04855 [Porcipelethomonas sp.]